MVVDRLVEQTRAGCANFHTYSNISRAKLSTGATVLLQISLLPQRAEGSAVSS
jgi:hypothetical protein